MNGLDDATVVQRQIGGGVDGGAAVPVIAMVPELVTLTAPLDFNTSDLPLMIEPVPKLFTVSRPSVTIAMLLA